MSLDRIKNKFIEKSESMELSGSHFDLIWDYVKEGLENSKAKTKKGKIKDVVSHLSDNYENLELSSSHYDIVEMYTTEILEECL